MLQALAGSRASRVDGGAGLQQLHRTLLPPDSPTSGCPLRPIPYHVKGTFPLSYTISTQPTDQMKSSSAAWKRSEPWESRLWQIVFTTTVVGTSKTTKATGYCTRAIRAPLSINEPQLCMPEPQCDPLRRSSRRMRTHLYTCAVSAAVKLEATAAQFAGSPQQITGSSGRFVGH